MPKGFWIDQIEPVQAEADYQYQMMSEVVNFAASDWRWLATQIVEDNPVNTEGWNMTRLEEKMALAREVGMKDWVASRLAEKEMKAEVELFTKLNFKVTNREEIEQKLETFYWSKWDWNVNEATFTFTLAFMGVSIACLAAHFLPLIHASLSFALGFFLAAVGLVVMDACPKPGYSELSSMDLSDWKDNIPYGALVAVKEAKAAGLKRFEIFYPIMAERASADRRLRADPVIVGYTGEHRRWIMYEVHAWDDGVIYE